MVLRGSFDFLVGKVRVMRLFKRNRKPLEVKVSSALVYGSGFSYRGAAEVVGLEGGRSPIRLLGGGSTA